MFAEVTQKNVDHHNSHPTRHLVITLVFGVCSVVATSKLAKRIMTHEPTVYYPKND